MLGQGHEDASGRPTLRLALSAGPLTLSVMASEPVAKLKQLQAEAAAVLAEESPEVQDDEKLTHWQRSVHFWGMVGKNFIRNRCPVRASALAYASLLALVPMLAVILSVSSSLLKNQGEKQIEIFIQKMVASFTPEADLGVEIGPPAPESAFNPEDSRTLQTRREVARRIFEFVGNIRSGTLGVSGMVVLLFVGISMLARIEDTFNDIWGITRGRTWFNRIVLYWAAITLGPLLLIVTMGLTTGPQLEKVRLFISNLHWTVEAGVLVGMRFLPYVILSLAFALFYLLMPNTKVHWRAALAGGVIGGCLWQLNNQFSVLYVSRVVTNSKIYGSLGMVPVVMIGLYFSWLILLFGAQVAYAFQNRRSYLQEKLSDGVNERGREFAALRLMTLIGHRHQAGEKPPTGLELASGLDIPSRLAGQILSLLVHARLLVEVAGHELAYAPGRPLDRITAQDILQAMRAGRGTVLATREDTMRDSVREEFSRIAEAERRQAASITLQDLVLRTTRSS